jgi:hypothetical protein
VWESEKRGGHDGRLESVKANRHQHGCKEPLCILL